jgi:hypothetical protein
MYCSRLPNISVLAGTTSVDVDFKMCGSTEDDEGEGERRLMLQLMATLRIARITREVIRDRKETLTPMFDRLATAQAQVSSLPRGANVEPPAQQAKC